MATTRYNKVFPVYNVDDDYKKLYLYSRSNVNGIKQYPTLITKKYILRKEIMLIITSGISFWKHFITIN